jgi:glycosyltransferase involved in cell wall biosynthesis
MQIITFLIVTKNSLSYLKNCINSIINQTAKNYLILIIDGASCDGTISYIKKLNNKNIKFISEPDQGIYDAMNKGLNLIESDWIIHLGSDDTLYSNTVLEEINSKAPFSNKLGLVYGSGIMGRKRLKNKFSKKLYFGNCLNHQCVIYNAKLLKKYGYDTTYIVGADYKLNLLLLKSSTASLYIPIIITNYGSEGISSTNLSLARYEEYKVRTEILGVIFGGFINLIKRVKICLSSYFNKFILYIGINN